MNKDFWNKVTELEELAKKATQGKWIGYYEDNKHINGAINNEDIHITLVNKSNCKNNTAFIAAANPTMIKEMVAELRQMELDIRGLKHDKQILEEATEKSAKDNLELRSSLNQLEKEADWLAEKARKCSFAYRNRSCHHLCVGNCSICLYDNRIVTAQDFREAARKAISEADNA